MSFQYEPISLPKKKSGEFLRELGKFVNATILMLSKISNSFQMEEFRSLENGDASMSKSEKYDMPLVTVDNVTFTVGQIEEMIRAANEMVDTTRIATPYMKIASIIREARGWGKEDHEEARKIVHDVLDEDGYHL